MEPPNRITFRLLGRRLLNMPSLQSEAVDGIRSSDPSIERYYQGARHIPCCCSARFDINLKSLPQETAPHQHESMAS